MAAVIRCSTISATKPASTSSNGQSAKAGPAAAMVMVVVMAVAVLAHGVAAGTVLLPPGTAVLRVVGWGFVEREVVAHPDIKFAHSLSLVSADPRNGRFRGKISS